MTEAFERLTASLTDRYRIERELGQGGMATVFLAEDLKHDRKVAIKVLRPELAAVIGAERFLKEIKTTANLQHPHILGLIDSGSSDGMLWYAMPFVDGESLRDRLQREKQLPIADAVRIATEAASALDYAHRHGVIHRDIKPENILLHDGSALVADFGIALAASKAGTRMTETGMSLGTPQYMSPEQAMGEREITARSDVYALGCVTFEMLTGEPPFSGPTAQAIVAKIMTAEPADITSLRKTIPVHVADAVHTSLQKLPADRFASAAEFAAALADRQFAAAGKPRVTSSRAVRGPATAQRGTYGLLAVCAALLVVALFGWLRPRSKADTSRQHVTLWQYAVASNLASGYAHSLTQAAIAPDGSSIVFVDSSGGTYRLMRKLRSESTPVPLAGTENGVSPFFSPDGRWIGYATTDGKLRKVPVDGGGSITLAEDVDKNYTSAAWLDDGTIIYPGNRQDLRRVSSSGGASRPVKADTTQRQWMASLLTIAPLPGSRGVLYTTCPGNCAIESSIRVYDFAADSSRVLVPNAAGAWYSPTGHLLYTDRAGGLYARGFDPKRMVLTSDPVPVIPDVIPTTFAISASGAVLYSVATGSGNPAELMWVARDGSAVPIDSTWRGDFGYPALSPDGKALAVSVVEGTTQLWIRRSDGSRQELTQDGTVNWRPAWTPDSKSVLFASNRNGKGGQNAFDLFRMPVDGSADPTLLLHHRFGIWEGEFSHDGQWLVFRADEFGANSNIRARRLTGDTTMLGLVTDKSLTMQVALSPDGHWLVYTGDATGRFEIYVTPFPAATSTRLVSRDGGIEPRWAHSGRELFYKSGDQLMAVDVTPGPALTLGVPRPLFDLIGYRAARNRPQYDVAPDDRHFVMIKDLDLNVHGDVVYVENWFQELLAKVKR